ncbi:MAG: hypothetical protein V4598_07145 [Bdellovibrionota bacterium]
MCFFYIDEDSSETTVVHNQISRQGNPPESDKSVLRGPASQPSSYQKVTVSHTKSGLSHPVWKEKLEATLKVQGGKLIAKIDIETVDTFDWKIGKVDVKVDSIIVKLENVNGQRSSFRAIVDATSGKILQTWDAPVIDNYSVKTSGDFKIDPRYHND